MTMVIIGSRPLTHPSAKRLSLANSFILCTLREICLRLSPLRSGGGFYFPIQVKGCGAG